MFPNMSLTVAREPLNKLCAAALRPEFSIATLQNLEIVRYSLSAFVRYGRLALKNSASQISSPKLVQRLPGEALIKSDNIGSFVIPECFCRESP